MNDEAQKELSRAEYWEKRYATIEDSNAAAGEDYEWFKTYDKLRPFLEKHLPSAASDTKVLHLGCGTSVCAVKRTGRS